MKILNKINNGILIIIIGVMHTKFGLSSDAFGKQFQEFSKTSFFNISKGLDELPVPSGSPLFETHAAFWFFYFGVLMFPIGFLVYSIEKKNGHLSHSFTISYLVAVLIGCYMVPNSGMTYIMLPHAIFMLLVNYFRARKSESETNLA